MSRERESTRSRRDRDREPDDEPATRTRSRERGSTDRKPKGGDKPVAINLNPESFETYGLWDNKEVAVISAYFAPWNYGGNLKKKDGTPFYTLGFFVEYRDLETGEEHTEPVAAGDLNFYAPGLSPNEEDYAGGSAEDFRKLASGEMSESDVDMEAMRGPYLLPVAQGYDDDGNPIYKRSSAARGTNMDFYLQQLAVCAKDAGIKLAFDPDDPHNINSYVAGIEGHVDRMSNSLRKGGANDDFGGAKSKPLVFTEIFEKKAGGAGSGGDRKSSKVKGRDTAKDDDEDEKPVNRRRAAPEPDPADDDEKEPAPARRGRSKKMADGPDADFLKDFEVKVEAALSELPKKSSKRTRLTHLMDDYEDRDEAKYALDILTEDEYIETFWAASELWDYDEKTDTATL